MGSNGDRGGGGDDDRGRDIARPRREWHCGTRGGSGRLQKYESTFESTFVPSKVLSYFRTFVFLKPKIHINYSEAIWKVKDGLPKFATMPAAFGGDDKMLEE